jgi:hypothetical protein
LYDLKDCKIEINSQLTPTYLVDEPHVIHGNHAQMSESTLKWTYFGHFWGSTLKYPCYNSFKM